ncbi:MAG: ABC transporter ATP-binding protein [Candidatus Rokubacteria bacterium]|nr:ABC transporter ATP-binding protein [Candidatus Rokubacteria bacterium]
MSEPILAIRGLHHQYAHTFGIHVDALDVHAGEVLAIIGPNGSGKSSLVRFLALLQAPRAGEVRFHGVPVTPRDGLAARRRMASVFQQPLLADTSVARNVALGLDFRGVPPDDREARVRRWLERLNIAPLADRPARVLSGGEAQRVALARALVLEPEVLFLDEPFSGLDQPTRATLVPDLAGILRRDRVTTVFVTHDRAEAQALADRVAVLMDGAIRQIDETTRVFQAPASEAIARFVGVETIVSGTVVAVENGVAVVDVAGCTLEIAAAARPGEAVRVGIRPEDVTLTHDRGALTSARNHLDGRVVRVTPSTPQALVLLDCGFPLVAAVTPRSVIELGLVAGAAVTAVFKASAPHLLREAARLDTPTRPGL